MTWRDDRDDININVPPMRMGSTDPGACGWWLVKDTIGRRGAIPHQGFRLDETDAKKLVGSTYLAADVIRFIIAGTLPCQLTGADDHG